MQTEIRPYRPVDRDAVAKLWAAAWHSTGLEFAQLATAEANRERLDRDIAAGWVVHLAWDETDRLVGFMALKPEEGQLDQLFVLPAAQSRGVGRTLLDLAKRELPAGIWLKTAAPNRRAHRFYERHGFHKDGTTASPTFSHGVFIYRWP